jgi:formylglycine-generating enzyme required for sulfatase activity
MPLPDYIDLPLTDDGVCIRLMRIPKGSFMMGARMHGDYGYADEEPVHEVSIPFDFYLGQTPVTQEQFAVWTKLTGLDHSNEFPDQDQHPAERMNWEEAAGFCEWATERYQFCLPDHKDWPMDYHLALPSEAQWEYACSAWQEGNAEDGVKGLVYTEYHTGDGSVSLNEAGWYAGNSGYKTRPVGEKQPNRHGLYDMHGNVNEWCADAWDWQAYRHRLASVENPIVKGEDNAFRVIRGGSWRDSASDCRAAFRDRWPPGYRNWNQGFRVGLFPVHSCQTKQSVSQPSQ